MLRNLGILVHPTKSVFEPSIQILRLWQSPLPQTGWDVAQVIGKIVASFPAVKYGALHYRKGQNWGLEDILWTFWSQNDTVKWQQTWTKMVGGQRPDSIQWCVWVNLIWLSLLMLALCHFWCSLTVWGYNYEGVQSGWHWSHAEKNFHINYLGIKAAFFALKCLLSKLQKKHEAAVSCLSHMGTNHSVSCNAITLAVWTWCLSHNIWISAAHTGQRQCSCGPRV